MAAQPFVNIRIATKENGAVGMLSSTKDKGDKEHLGSNLLWVFPKEDPQLKEAIIKEFSIHPVAAQFLISRGLISFDQIHQYLYAKLPDLHDPFLLGEMPQAVARILQAIRNKENILIYGDNDVDGMTGTALLTDFFEFIGASVFFYVFTRTSTRRSLIIEALEYALQNHCTLLITVDCGITAAAEIAEVSKQNVDVIITDHHEPTDKIPHCVATLNPKLLNSLYPNRELTGVGVAFKLAHAVTQQLVADGMISEKKVDLKRYLDLVALGTIADMGLLLEENRVLVRYGLKQLRKTKRVGLAKLISVCNLSLNDLSPFTIATKVAPRLNSLGRIDDPQKGVRMLLVRNPAEAEKLALELDVNNSERQKIERTLSAEVDNLLNIKPEILNDKAIVIASKEWHPGIIAIVTTRLCRFYNRPTVLIAIDQGIGKGSLRSIPEFPLIPILKECEDILLNYGGHDFAAGLSIKEEHIEEFTRRFIKMANDRLQAYNIIGKIALDAEIKFTELTFDFMESVKLLEPFGNGNLPPIFYCEAKQVRFPKVVGNANLKLYIEQGDRVLEGMAFGKAHLLPMLKKRNLMLRLAFTPQLSHHAGTQPMIQLLIRDFQVIDDTSRAS